MSKKANFFAIGIFVITASILAGLTLLVFGTADLNKQTEKMIVTFKGSTNGLRVGAPVKAFGVEIGKVRRIMLHKIQDTDEVVIPVMIELDLDHIGDLLGVNRAAHLDDRSYQEILESGTHAKLELQSFVTGLLYVEIEFGNQETGFVLEDERFAEYRSLPTLPTDLQEIIQSAGTVVQNLSQTDFAGLVEEIRSVVVELRAELKAMELAAASRNLNDLVDEARSALGGGDLGKSFEDLSETLQAFREVGLTLNSRTGETLDQLDQTLVQLEAAATGARSWLNPGSALYRELVTALDQIGDASRSLRVLVEYLERNPNALITGRNLEESNP